MMKVLIAEDDVTSRTVLKHMLAEWGYEVVVTNDGDEAWEALQAEDAPRLAILDWMMPGIDGVEVSRRLREKEKDQEEYTYVLLLTAMGTKDNIVTGMEAGADDYLVKPFDRHELRVRVRAGRRIIELQSDLLAARQDLIKLSNTDALTGLLNRRAIMAGVATEIARSQRNERMFGLSLLDIDYFKKVNDTYGHLTGDAVLQECAKRISSALRPYDSVGRYGGEEFLLIIPGGEENSAWSVAQRVRSVIGSTDMDVDGTRVRVTVSQGVVTWDGNASIEELIDAADKSLYLAKENGRDRVERAQTLIKR
ncbi:MAG: diguanylate cyclase [Deltaproteobacteria bacterium]|jgi:diguanylate cyclase (GGDEF)-like protein|nr:diguanylate cyclase [Deltaproteobacteria bacterium]MDL1976839.1 diguanylate cyclase [Deltaproteobacteria bacterium]